MSNTVNLNYEEGATRVLCDLFRKLPENHLKDILSKAQKIEPDGSKGESLKFQGGRFDFVSPPKSTGTDILAYNSELVIAFESKVGAPIGEGNKTKNQLYTQMNDLLRNYTQQNKYVVLVSNDLRMYNYPLSNRPYFQLLWDDIYRFCDRKKIQFEGKNELNKYRYHFHQTVFTKLFQKAFESLKKECFVQSGINTQPTKDMEYFFYGFDIGLPLDVLVGIQVFASNRIVVRLHNIEQKLQYNEIKRISDNFMKKIGIKPNSRGVNKHPLFFFDFSYITNLSQISENDFKDIKSFIAKAIKSYLQIAEDEY